MITIKDNMLFDWVVYMGSLVSRKNEDLMMFGWIGPDIQKAKV